MNALTALQDVLHALVQQIINANLARLITLNIILMVNAIQLAQTILGKMVNNALHAPLVVLNVLILPLALGALKIKMEIIISNNQIQQLVLFSALIFIILLLMQLQRVILVEFVILNVSNVMVRLLINVTHAGQII